MAERFNWESLIPHDEMLGLTTSQFSDQQAQNTSYRPTIIIGLGGTGYTVVRKLRRRIQAHYGAERARIFQYLAVDTAPEQPPAGESALGAADFLYLPSFPANEMIENLSARDPLKKWWPAPHIPTYAGVGAGGVRAVGRLVLHRYANTLIVPTLRAKIQNAVEIAEAANVNHAQNIKVYIVCSIAGGTGSGMLLDMATIARHEVISASNGECYITAVLVMPSAYVGIAGAPRMRQRFRANGYSALRELDLLISKGGDEIDFGGGYRAGNRAVGMRPFNIAYLLGLFNENGQALPNVGSLTEMIAEELMLEIASPLENLVTNVLDNVDGTDEFVDGHPAAYSSFAVSSLVYPLAGVASWCGLKFEGAFLRQVLLQPIRSYEDAEREVDQFIDANHLREENADQVITALNSDEGGNQLQLRLLSYDTFQGIPDTDVLATFQSELPLSRAQLELAKKEIVDRRRKLIEETPARIRSHINLLIRDPERGPTFAAWFLSKLEAKFAAYRRDQMMIEEKNFQAELATARDSLATTQQEIEEALGMWRLDLRRARAIEQAITAHIGVHNTTLTAEHQARLRESAALLYLTLLETVALLANETKALRAAFEREAEIAEETAEQARVRLRVTQPPFSLVKTLINEVKLRAAYEAHRPPIDTPEQQRALVAGFWAFLLQQAPDWTLGNAGVVHEGEPAQAFYYLGQLFGEQLAAVPLLDRLRAEEPDQGRHADRWITRVQERYNQAAPFWSMRIARAVFEIEANLQRTPNLVGYGEDVVGTQWETQLSNAIGHPITAVQTTNSHELVVLKTAHALPLFAINEVAGDLFEAYQALQKAWQSGDSKTPVHASKVWEEEVTKRDRVLAAPAKKPARKPPAKSSTSKPRAKAPAGTKTPASPTTRKPASRSKAPATGSAPAPRSRKRTP